MNVTGEHRGDPLAALRDELVAAARRRTLARRRRRRSLVVAALAGALVMLTGAALAVTGAVTGVTTGVAAIDRLIGQSSQPFQGRGLRTPDRRPTPRVRPADAESVSPPLAVTLPDGTKATAVGYRTSDGSICTALAREGSRPIGSIGCLGRRFFRRELQRSRARVIGGGGGPGGLAVVSGFARPEVEALTARTPTGRVHAQLSPAWNPNPNTEIRMFYVFVDSRRSPPLPPMLRFDARLEDGTTVPIAP